MRDTSKARLPIGAFQEFYMRPLKRKPVSRYAGAKKFRAQSRRTKRVNIVGPMRGGIRL